MQPTQLAYSVDVSRWPLVVVAPTAAVRDDAALEATYVAIEALIARKQKFVLLIDVRGAYSDPTRRKRLAAWISRHRPALDYLVVAVASLVGSTLERGFVTAALWLLPTPREIRVFTDRAEAEAWLMHRFDQR